MNESGELDTRKTSSFLIVVTKWICCSVIIASVLACVIIAAVRSNGLSQVRVTAIEAQEEPRDHNIPLFKQKEALPDYQIVIRKSDGQNIPLATKPNTSAVGGILWELNDPVATAEIAGIRLVDQDHLVSDTITEVEFGNQSVTSGNYKFEFETERSATIGVYSFFRTPIGMSIAGAFFLAILVIILSQFPVLF